jgi:hemoglobin-like flavoprotein
MVACIEALTEKSLENPRKVRPEMSTTQTRAYVPSTADLEAHDIVKKQFGEGSANLSFFDDFYREFTRQSPEIAAAFAKTDMKSQKEALRSGLAFLIMYSAGNSFANDKLDRLGKTHCRTGYNIQPKLYPLWIESLVRTVKKHVPNFDRASETAWRHVLQLGVNRIQSWY